MRSLFRPILLACVLALVADAVPVQPDQETNMITEESASRITGLHLPLFKRDPYPGGNFSAEVCRGELIVILIF
jgi:hypothetical protein